LVKTDNGIAILLQPIVQNQQHLRPNAVLGNMH
jgi:hypothetical protein